VAEKKGFLERIRKIFKGKPKPVEKPEGEEPKKK